MTRTLLPSPIADSVPVQVMTSVDSSPYSSDQLTLYLRHTHDVGRRWLAVFAGNKDFYSAAYWDLLTGLWASPAPVRKTEALAMMTAVKSAHTAGKYLEVALRQGLLEESANPEDARSRLIALSPAMRVRLDAFFSEATHALCETASQLQQSSAR